MMPPKMSLILLIPLFWPRLLVMLTEPNSSDPAFWPRLLVMFTEPNSSDPAFLASSSCDAYQAPSRSKPGSGDAALMPSSSSKAAMVSVLRLGIFIRIEFVVHNDLFELETGLAPRTPSSTCSKSGFPQLRHSAWLEFAGIRHRVCPSAFNFAVVYHVLPVREADSLSNVILVLRIPKWDEASLF